MKKLISLLTIISMIFALMVTPVNAEAEDVNFTLEQAIEIAKEKLELNTEGYEFYSSYYEDYYSGRKQWELNWYNTSGNGDSINVSIDAMTGDIVNYYNWGRYEEQKVRRLPKYTKEQAKKAAEEFIKKLAGDKFDETKFFENYYEDPYLYYNENYSFSYVRYVDGIEYQNNSIYVNIDKNTLKVRSYYLNWDKDGFPSADEAITKEEARKIFEEKLGLELTYQLIYPTGSQVPKAVLAYTLKNGTTPIDAITGELITNSYYYPMYYSEVALKSSMVVRDSITVEEKKEIDKNSKYISKDDAVKIALEYLPDVANYNLSNANLNPGYGTENATWYLSWQHNDFSTGSYAYASASIDAVTKELKSFYKDSSDMYNQMGADPVYTEEQALEIAGEFLQKLQPEKFPMTEYKKYEVYYGDGYQPPYYSFNFVRKENDIFCPFNSLYVNVNIYTGEITSYSYYWVETELPSSENVITLEQAYEAMFAKSDMALKYMKQYNYREYLQTAETKLAYVLEYFYGMIDANTGTVIGYDGEPITEITPSKVEFTDIAGNKAEADIKLLVEIGVVQASSEFKPDDKIQQRDFVKMLMKAIQPYYYYYPMYQEGSQSEYDVYYAQAIEKKILTEREKNPDGYVSRQEASKMLVRALGYGTIAERANIFVADFEDFDTIVKQYRGYTVIAKELEIFKLKDKNFNPKDMLTRGDSATALINFLKVDLNQ